VANDVQKQIIEEGPRNAIVKVTGVIDTNDINLISFITPANFSNNDPRLRLTGFRVDEVIYSIGQTLDMVISWNGALPQQILPLAKSGKFDLWQDGGAIPDATRDGYDGSINIRSTGFVAGTVQEFSLQLRLVKLYSVT
jgi:hypothetical protein